MPRPNRFELVGVPQHIIQRGNNRQDAFFMPEDYRFYLECLKQAADLHRCDVHAYVLMSNHVHLLVTPHEAGGIGRMMQSVGRRYVRFVNARQDRSGTLWEGRYKASLIDTGPHVLDCYRFIESNPLRAGLVDHPGAYAWSSYHWHANGQDDSIVRDHGAYRSLATSTGERQRLYRDLFRTPLEPDAVRDIVSALNQCRVYGSDSFKDEIERTLLRPVRPGKVGRPRKQPASPQSLPRKIAV